MPRPAGRQLRPRVEPLEDRANPVALSFVPMTVTAFNPQPLPPTALVQFNPLPVLTGLPTTANTVMAPVQIDGTFQQTLTVTGPSASPVAVTGQLALTYSLHGTVTLTTTPPDPTAGTAGSFHAAFSLSGSVTAVVYPPQPPGLPTPPPWVLTATVGERGSVAGLLPGPASTTPAVANFTEQVSLSGSERHVFATATGGTDTPWAVSATLSSSGSFKVPPVPPGPTPDAVTVTTPFAAQDQFAASLVPVTPFGTPPPLPIRVSGAATAAGAVTESVYQPGRFVLLPTVKGTERYQEGVSETIVIPPSPTQPGSTQTLTQAFDTAGVFHETEFSPVIDPPVFGRPDGPGGGRGL
jgi:hypothetical protein